MLWLSMYIFVKVLQFSPCIWLFPSRWWLQYLASFLGRYGCFSEHSYAASVTSDFSFCCLNSGLPKHYLHFADSFSYVVLSFYSSVVLNFVWYRLSSFFGSDRYPILLSTVHPSSPPFCSSRWNFDRVDFAGFPLQPKFILFLVLCILRYCSRIFW